MVGQRVGGYDVTVRTAPGQPRTGRLHVEVQLIDPETLAYVERATVSVVARFRDGKIAQAGPVSSRYLQSAGITLVKGDLSGIVRARHLSRSVMRNIRKNLFLAFVYNSLGVPIAAGVLYPFFGLLLSPIVAAAAMSLSSLSVVGNALRLRTVTT